MRRALLLVLPVLLVLPLVVSAQVTDIPRTAPITTTGGVLDFLDGVLDFIFILVGILAVIALLISAILFVTAGGNEDRRKSAGAWLRYGIIGVIVAIVAGSIIPIIGSILAL